MNTIKSATLKKGVEVGHRTGHKVAIRVRNIWTHFANMVGAPKCRTLRLLQKAEHDLDKVAQIRTDLTESQRLCFGKLKTATVDVYSCKAMFGKDVGEFAQSLTSSLKGLESFMLNFEHVERELLEICDAFCKLYFEARYGDYLVSPCSRADTETFPFNASSMRDFSDPEELVKAARFDLLSRRVIEDLTSLESDFERLPVGIRDDPTCYDMVEKALKLYRNRYFESLNRETGNYQLSDYGAQLQEENDREEREIAAEAMGEGTEESVEQGCSASQPLQEYVVLDSEIYRSDGTSRTTTDEVTSSETASNASREVDT